MYYLIYPDGTSLFTSSMPYDFCISCLITLLCRDDRLADELRLLSVPELRLVQSGLLSLSACDRLLIPSVF